MKARITTARKRAAKGFTLIEMMIVVAIIGIVAAVIAVNFVHSKSNAQVSATEANLKQIGTGLELYNSDNQTYPVSANVSSTLMGPKYLNNTPNSPGPSGGAYVYTLAATSIEYTITDPATYDAASLANLGKATVAAGVATAPTAKCGSAGCTHVGFSNSVGIFGY